MSEQTPGGRDVHDCTVPTPLVDDADPTRVDAVASRERALRPLPEPGARIGQYEVIRELGRGGMGAVYLARDTRLGRRVAIKFLRSGKPELNARFLLEARATARCNHENIVVIHEVGERGGDPFMVLEYLEGIPLGKELEGGRRLPPGRAVEIAVGVVRALVRAHAHGIVHRDLKPDNIFLSRSGTVKVLDFGIAKLLGDDRVAAGPTAGAALADDETGQVGASRLTRDGTLLGTLPYMSPEQWGSGEVDHRTDVWAMGIILYRMLAGKHPLAPVAGRGLMVTGVLSIPMPRAREVCPDLPVELADIVDRCLIKPREDRLGSAEDLLDVLEPLLPARVGRTLRADESPYAGLRAFQEADAHRFFGRGREIAAALARLRETPLVGVVGASGVGKSSFVRAG